MVHEHSISFAAPSQLRLHMVADEEGNAQIAVLNAYNQPIGNLGGLKIPKADMAAFLAGKADEAIAKNDEASCRFTVGTDHAHETYAVNFEEPAKWVKMLDYVIIEEFKELFESISVPVSDGPTVI